VSHKHGTYLGGIRSVEDLRQRCRVDEDTGCWHWGMSVVQGAPRVHFKLEDGKHRVTRGPAAAWMLSHQKQLPAKTMCWMRCRRNDCVNPRHVMHGDRKKYGEFARKHDLQKNNPRRIAANRKIVREKLARINIETAREIRLSEGPQAEIARRYGVPQSLVWAIKAGKLWREELPGASVFSLAGAPSLSGLVVEASQ
jgi:hypothetical protein